MEIKRFRELYEKYSPEDFYNWISQGRTMEIRFLNDNQGNKFNDWDLIRTISDKIGAEYRYNSIYIDNFSQLKQILLFRINGVVATKIYNIYIGANPRRKIFTKSKNGLLRKTFQGSIAGTSHIQNVVCDIETKTHKEKGATEEEIEACIQGAKHLVKVLNAEEYYINISGNGVHLWLKIKPAIELPIPNFVEFPDKIKYKLKEEPIINHIKMYQRFIEKLNKLIQEYNPNLIVDEGAKDIARVARPAGSWNVKANRIHRAVGTIDSCTTEVQDNLLGNTIYKLFTSADPLPNKKSKEIHQRAITTNIHRYNYLNIGEAPIVKLLLSKMLPSILSRNHYLENSLARLIRDNNISLNQIQDLISEIDGVQNKTIQIDPDYLDDEEPFNSEMVNSYCYGSKIDLVYPLLEEVPEVSENYIDENRYTSLNSYSWQTVDKMAIKQDLNLKSPNSYLELKILIRKLVDSYDKIGRAHV